MRRKSQRPNFWKIFALLLGIALLFYINRMIEPLPAHIFLASPTATVPPEDFIAEAESYALEGKYSLALQSYNQAVIADPQNPRVYVALSRLHVYSGKYEEAINQASNALLLSPENSMAEALKGIAQGFLGNYLDAESSLQRAVELDPSNPFAYAYSSIVYAQKILNNQALYGELDKAIESSRKAEAIAPNAIETKWARGMILEITGNFEEAVQEYEAAVVQNANIPELHIALGRTHTSLLRYDRAIEEYTKAKALNPTDPNPDTYISNTYARVGEFAKAILFAEQAIANKPNDPYLYGNLGVLYKQNFQFEQAINALKLAIRGGVTPQGGTIEGLPLAYGRVVAYYYFYGFALMELGYCGGEGEAVDIAQSILQSMQQDQIAIANAQEILDRCYKILNDYQLLKLPAPTMIPTWTPIPSPTPESSPTVVPTNAGS